MGGRRAAFFFLSFSINGVFSFLGLSLFTRILSPDAYGVYSLYVTAGTLINAFCYQWVRLCIVRRPVLDDGVVNAEQQKSALIIGFSASVIVGFIVSLCAGRLYPAFDAVIGGAFLLFGISLAQGVYEIALADYRMNARDLTFSAANVSRAIVFIGVGWCVLTLFSASAGALLGALLVSYFLPVFVEKFFSLKKWGGVFNPFSYFSREALLGMARYGLPTIVSTASFVSYPFIARAYLNAKGGAHEVGLFVAGYDLVNLMVSTAMLAVNFASYNKLLGAYTSGVELVFRRAVLQHIKFLMAVGIFVLICVFLFEPLIENVLLGESFRSKVKDVILAGGVCAFVFGVRQFWFDHAFYFSKKTSLFALISIFGVVLFSSLLYLAPLASDVSNVLLSLFLSQIVVMLVGVGYMRSFFSSFMHPIVVFGGVCFSVFVYACFSYKSLHLV